VRVHAGRRTARGRRIAMLLVVGVTVAAAWWQREALLAWAGEAIVAEDPARAADVVVVSIASVRAGALEAARLYRAGLGKHIVVSRWREEPVDTTIRALGVAHLLPHELARGILEQSGVPQQAVVVLEEPVDGTESEIAAVSRFARQERLESLLLITARSHSARARWLLRRTMPADVRVAVQSGPADGFQPQGWWRDREQTRELVMEYLRWLQTVLAGAAAPGRAVSREPLCLLGSMPQTPDTGLVRRHPAATAAVGR
jgi:uncharacterized SAM-binding protein YcdF (DUF218 family)